MAGWYGVDNCKVCICLKVWAKLMNKPRLSRYVVILSLKCQVKVLAGIRESATLMESLSLNLLSHCLLSSHVACVVQSC